MKTASDGGLMTVGLSSRASWPFESFLTIVWYSCSFRRELGTKIRSSENEKDGILHP